jgi:hypothetical protein
MVSESVSHPTSRETIAEDLVISPHQDVFSRFISGSGAPYWALEAVGLNPKRIHQTGSGVIHSAWETHGRGGEEGIAAAKEGKVGSWPDSESFGSWLNLADDSDLEHQYWTSCGSTLRDHVLGW